jgi:hypothetical protein
MKRETKKTKNLARAVAVEPAGDAKLPTLLALSISELGTPYGYDYEVFFSRRRRPGWRAGRLAGEKERITP